MKKLLSIFCLTIFMMSMTTIEATSKEIIQKKDCVEETFDFVETLDNSPLSDDIISCLGNGFYAVCEGWAWDGSC
ncbi:hypothetical protein ACFSQP_07235 [Bizionia sediminis]|uniref:Uncharacterized protein n=1 Tax=Bizionia sediminis TaxID=1737064 RepID=A0ABW5KVK9_9FLAO